MYEIAGCVNRQQQDLRDLWIVRIRSALPSSGFNPANPMILPIPILKFPRRKLGTH